MSRPVLLVVRVPPRHLVHLHEQFPAHFDVVCVDQLPAHHVKSLVPFATVLQDWPCDEVVDETLNFYDALALSLRVTHAIVCQPLLWYSNAVAQALRNRGVKLWWTEAHWTKLHVDALGCDYTPDNEILQYEHQVPVLPFTLPPTRFPQPLIDNLSALGDPDNTVIIMGQVPFDMSLVQNKGLSYHEWLEALVAENPSTRFIFKHHPRGSTEIPTYPNLSYTNDSIHELFRRFRYFAAFSSTTIIEALMHGCRVVTGGYHYMSGITLEVTNRGSFGDIVRQLNAHRVDRDLFNVRASFVLNRYGVNLNNPLLTARLLGDIDTLTYYRHIA